MILQNLKIFIFVKCILQFVENFLLTPDFGEGENDGIKRLNVLEWFIGNKK